MYVLLFTSCKSNDQSANSEELAIKGAKPVIEYGVYESGTGWREFNAFVELNPGLLLVISYEKTLTADAENQITNLGPVRNRIEIRKQKLVECKDATNKAGYYRDRDTGKCYTYGDMVLSEEISVRKGEFKYREDLVAIAEGVFYKGQLVGLFGEFICRDSEIGKTGTFEVSPGSQDKRSYSVVRCNIPGAVNGKVSSVVVLMPNKK